MPGLGQSAAQGIQFTCVLDCPLAQFCPLAGVVGYQMGQTSCIGRQAATDLMRQHVDITISLMTGFRGNHPVSTGGPQGAGHFTPFQTLLPVKTHLCIGLQAGKSIDPQFVGLFQVVLDGCSYRVAMLAEANSFHMHAEFIGRG